MAKRAKSKAGRPKNEPEPSSLSKHTTGDKCRRCGSPMKRGKVREDRSISGVIAGFTYRRVIHIAAQCKNPACGQRGTIRDLIA